MLSIQHYMEAVMAQTPTTPERIGSDPNKSELSELREFLAGISQSERLRMIDLAIILSRDCKNGDQRDWSDHSDDGNRRAPTPGLPVKVKTTAGGKRAA